MMRIRFRVITSMALMMAIYGLTTPLVKAQEATKPVAIVSVAPLEQVLKDSSYLLRAANVPEFGGVLSMMGNQYTQGIDQTRPLGAGVNLKAGQPSPLIFLPVADLQQFFGALQGVGIEPDDLGDGLYEIDAGMQLLYAKQSGDWLFVAMTENDLETLPDDPASLLGSLPERYAFAFRLNVQELPEDLRNTVGEQMQLGFNRGMSEQTGQSEEEREAIRQAGEAQIQQIEKLLAEAEQFIFGWAIDSQEQKTYIDSGVQFIEGSDLAEQSNSLADLKSDFTDLRLAGESASFRFTSKITSEQDKRIAKQNLKNSMRQLERQIDDSDDVPERAKQPLKEFAQGFMKIIEQTVDEGKFDGAGSVSVSDDVLKVLIGGRLADGQALAAEVQKLVEKSPQLGDTADVQLGYEDYSGVTLHRVEVIVPSSEVEAQKILGDKLQLTIGTGEKSFFVLLDPTGDTALKSAIDAIHAESDAEVSPFASVIQVTPLLEFAQSVSPNSMLDNAIQKIRQFSGKDRIQLAGRVIPRGGVYRLTIEEGVLQTIGAAAKAGNNPGGGF